MTIRDEENLLNEDAAPTLTKFSFQTFGPFWLTSGQDLSSISIANKFWNEVEERYPALHAAIGVYVFVVQPTRKSALCPWYVGKTDRGFRRRFHQHKKLFPKLLDKNGKCAVFLIARLDESLQFMKPRKHLESINILETMLIERCIAVNPRLFNASKVKHVKGLIVPGFKNDGKGKPTNAARQLKAMLDKKFG